MQIDNDTQHIPGLAAPKGCGGAPERTRRPPPSDLLLNMGPPLSQLRACTPSPPTPRHQILPPSERQREVDERRCFSRDRTVNVLSVCTHSDPFGRAFCGFIKLNDNTGHSTACPQSTYLASKKSILHRKKGKKRVCGHLAQTHFISDLDYTQKQSQ